MGKLKGQLPKAYLRLDPNIDATHPDVGAMVKLLCAAHRQPRRGRFKSRAVLDAAIGRKAAASALLRNDVIPEGERLYVDGWDEWQEGDFTVGERMKRLRSKRGQIPDERNNAVTTPFPGSISTPGRRGSKAARQQDSKAGSPGADVGAGGPNKPDGAEAAASGGERPAVQPVDGDVGRSPLAASAASEDSGPDHDHENELEARLARRVVELAAKAGSTWREVLRSVSTTPGGKQMTEIRGAGANWIRQTLRDCDAFEADLDGESGPTE